MAELPPQLRNQIAQLQQIQQQAQAVVGQRVQLEMQHKEIERTLQELGKVAPETPVYRSIGTLLIRAKDLPAVRKDLEEALETNGIRLSSMKRQEERLKERLTALQKEVESALGGGRAG